MGRLLLDGDSVVVLVELHDAEALGVIHAIAKYRGTALLCGRDRSAEVAREAIAVEDVVSQDERAGLPRHEVSADNEGLCKTVGLWLLRI